MLLLFETAAGFALFKVLKEDKLKNVDVSAGAPARGSASETATDTFLLPQDLWEDFSSLDAAQKVR